MNWQLPSHCMLCSVFTCSSNNKKTSRRNDNDKVTHLFLKHVLCLLKLSGIWSEKCYYESRNAFNIFFSLSALCSFSSFFHFCSELICFVTNDPVTVHLADKAEQMLLGKLLLNYSPLYFCHSNINSNKEASHQCYDQTMEMSPHLWFFFSLALFALLLFSTLLPCPHFFVTCVV